MVKNWTFSQKNWTFFVKNFIFSQKVFKNFTTLWKKFYNIEKNFLTSRKFFNIKIFYFSVKFNFWNYYQKYFFSKNNFYHGFTVKNYFLSVAHVQWKRKFIVRTLRSCNLTYLTYPKVVHVVHATGSALYVKVNVCTYATVRYIRSTQRNLPKDKPII